MKNMASDNHYLLRFFTSKNPMYSLIKVLPLLAFLIYVLMSSPFHYLQIIAFGLGIIYWSLFEYFVYRIVYHKRTNNKELQWYLDAFHLHHHKNLRDYRVLNAGFLLVYPLALSLLLIVYWFTNSIVLMASFGFGAILYYLFYEYVHYEIHHKIHKTKYLKNIQKYHLYHHYYKWNKNFGNTTTLWDKVFGTYDGTYKTIVYTEEQINDLILKK
ncbi:sterol desaturase family protein [Tenacibaculum sp. 190524A02b]|uniref:sterol desaturase family protein n=1 Tax=Tenacibaculum vairaonense TaxID=3137860 RepID=UPI0031FAFA60